MKYQRGYKYALRLSGAQRKHFANEFGANRFVFNKLLESTAEQYKLFKEGKGDKPVISYFSLSKKLISLKREYPFLKERSIYTLRDSCNRLGTALTKFVKGQSKYPKFKSRKGKQSVTYHRTDKSYEFKLVEQTVKGQKVLFLKAPKLKSPIKVLWHRYLPSVPTQCTISRDSTGEYWVSFLCERAPIITNGDSITGIDLGLKDIVTTSEGYSIESPKYLRKSEKRLAIAQRNLSRKKKGSNNRHKQRLKVAKIHKKISNQRNYFLHSASRKLVNDNQVIGLETLNVKGMRRALNLGKSVNDVGLGILLRFICYKAEESQHCKILMYPAFFPSTQVCSNCFHRLTGENKLSLKSRKWICPMCSTEHHRDINAAKLLKEAAIRYLEKYLPKDLKNKHGVIVIDPEIGFDCLFPESVNYS